MGRNLDDKGPQGDTSPDKVGFIPHRCKGCWLFVIFGEHQVMARLIATRVLIFPLINKDFPVRHLLLARGDLLP
jgi:hypothetical protein